MPKNGYNGWANKPTWSVGLWLNNSQGDYRHWSERAEHLTTEELAEEIQQAVEEGSPTADGASLYSDLMTGSLGQVDWKEVAESFQEE